MKETLAEVLGRQFGPRPPGAQEPHGGRRDQGANTGTTITLLASGRADIRNKYPEFRRKIAPIAAVDRDGSKSKDFSVLAGCVQMLRATQGWPWSIRLAATGAAVATTCLFQLPLEREVPGEPFLLFLSVVVASALAFGANLGFVAVGLSTLLSGLFFDPVGSLAVHHAADLVKIELYAILASASVVGFAQLGNTLNLARDNADSLKCLNESKVILLRELAHGVANNFATVAAFISVKSAAVTDALAKSVLDETIEMVKVRDGCMGGSGPVIKAYRWTAAPSFTSCARNSKFQRRWGDQFRSNAKPTAVHCAQIRPYHWV
jgi:two-component sensor histidine kinase